METVIKTNLTRLARLARKITVDLQYERIYIYGYQQRAEYGACFEVHIHNVLKLAEFCGWQPLPVPDGFELDGEELQIAEQIDLEHARAYLHDFEPFQLLEFLDQGACGYNLVPDSSTETGLTVTI